MSTLLNASIIDVSNNDGYHLWVVYLAFPKIVKYTAKAYVSTGKAIVLKCTGFSKTKPIMIAWIKNNMTLKPSQNEMIMQENVTEYSVMSQLIMNSTMYNSNDTYQCRVSNPFSSVTSQDIIVIFPGMNKLYSHLLLDHK